jgi:hypothetical protein
VLVDLLVPHDVPYEKIGDWDRSEPVWRCPDALAGYAREHMSTWAGLNGAVRSTNSGVHESSALVS